MPAGKWGKGETQVSPDAINGYRAGAAIGKVFSAPACCIDSSAERAEADPYSGSCRSFGRRGGSAQSGQEALAGKFGPGFTGPGAGLGFDLSGTEALARGGIFKDQGGHRDGSAQGQIVSSGVRAA